MNELVWTNNFLKSIKKSLKIHPELENKLDFTFELLETDVFHPLLHTHKLKGNYPVAIPVL